MRLLLSLLLLTASLPAAAMQNTLKNHPSPYLAMHGDDPVYWQDWGDAVLELARREGKLILISSGYFSCHWCHVMQRESYKDAEVAAQLNTHFIPVKLDRELHPALDAHLIDFVERTTGSGGWPLNVFLTPEGYPLVGLTYAPRDNFLALLSKVQELWRNEPAKARQLAESAMTAIVQARAGMTTKQVLSPAEVIPALRHEALSQANEMEGGFGEQARFPMAPQILALLDGLSKADDARLRAFLVTTLDQMATQGLRDHLAGGFFRYTVDPSWQVPHYEKMLYDQALLARVYLRAGQVLKRPDYLAVAADTLDFVLKDMAHPEGGYIASLSAVDAAGVEGGPYLWDVAQLEATLQGEQLALARAHWRLQGIPAMEGGYLPMMGKSITDLSDTAETSRIAAILADARVRLLKAREARGLPRDDKRLAGWNGLLLQALAEAQQLLPDPHYREAAVRLQAFIRQRLWNGQALVRSLDGGHAGLEDYAQVAAGLAAMGESDLQQQLLKQAWQRFHSAAGWRRSDLGLLPGMAVEPGLMDDVMPSSSAVIVALSLKTAVPALREQAVRAQEAAAGAVATSAFWYAGHALLQAERGAQR